jgi:hypothetical protein
MVRRLLMLLPLLAVLAGGSALGVVDSSAASVGQHGVCVLAGKASISPGLTTKSHSISYTFSGSLKNCKSTVSNITSGSVSASGSGTGSCAQSATHGTGTIHWNNGTTSYLSFTTTGVGALLEVAGKVTSGEFAGINTKAALIFQATPTQCTTSTGVTNPSFTGPAELGS